MLDIHIRTSHSKLRLIAVFLLIVFFLVAPAAIRAQGPTNTPTGSSPAPSLDWLNSIGILAVFLLYVGIREVQGWQRDKQHFNLINSLASLVKDGTDNQTTLTAIQGLSQSVPPQVLTDVMAILLMGKTIAPGTSPLLDGLQKLLNLPDQTQTGTQTGQNPAQTQNTTLAAKLSG